MKSKTKTNKVPKSPKTRLSDLPPKKDARGGMIPESVPGALAKANVALTSKTLTSKRRVTS